MNRNVRLETMHYTLVVCSHVCSVLLPEINCMRDLLRFYRRQFRYFINLTGQEFPLRTNLELVRIARIFNGSNDIAGSSTRYTRNNRTLTIYAEQVSLHLFSRGGSRSLRRGSFPFPSSSFLLSHSPFSPLLLRIRSRAF